MFGGLLGATILTFFIVIARPIVLAFGLPEMLMITVLGLSMVAILAGRIPLKGVGAACMGLMVGTIGEAAAGGSLRMSTYDILYLTDGLKLVIVGMGIFAIPEIISLLRQDRAIARDAKLGAGWLHGVRDWWNNIWLSIRCAIIGVIVGVIPGLGGSVVDWIAYGHAVQTTPDKSRFGSGEIRGVIGPESSNNAKEGGGLVPTLIFGIPGSGSMAIFIGGLLILGYDAGTQLITNNLDLTYVTVWSLALANVVGAGLCILLSSSIARLTTIRFTLLAPFLFMMITFAAFQSGQSLGDLVSLWAIGLVGILLRRFDWSRPAFLIGFVLSRQAENYSFQAYQIAVSKLHLATITGLKYIFSPIVIVLIVITTISIVVGIRQAKSIMSEGDVKVGRKRGPLIFLVSVTIYFVISYFDAFAITIQTDRIFPMTVSLIGTIACLLLLIRMFRSSESDIIFADREASGEDADAPHGFWATMAWFAALLVLSSLVGFILALMVFLVAFFRIRAGCSWRKTLILTAAGIVFMCFMAGMLNRDFPPGLLQAFVELPWPLSGI